MQTFNLEQTITAWSSVAKNVFVPHTEKEYEHLDIKACLAFAADREKKLFKDIFICA